MLPLDTYIKSTLFPKIWMQNLYRIKSYNFFSNKNWKNQVFPLLPRKKVWTHFEKKLIHGLNTNKIIMIGVLIFGVTSPLNHGHVPWEGFVELFQVGWGDLLPHLSRTFFPPILKMIPFRLLLAISKPFKLQQWYCNRVIDLLSKINLLF